MPAGYRPGLDYAQIWISVLRPTRRPVAASQTIETNCFCLLQQVMIAEWKMDRTMPPFNMEPDPAFEIEVENFRIPVLELPREFIPAPIRDRKIRIYALAAYHTPTGNIKYIPASYMLKRASETGLCQKGQTVVEATSGNFGDSLAFCAKRYRLTVAAIVSDRLPEGKLLSLLRQGTQILKEGEVARLLNLTRRVPTTELAHLYAEKIGGVHLNQYGNPVEPRELRHAYSTRPLAADRRTSFDFCLGNRHYRHHDGT
jgi:hypothetical protein